MSDLTEARRKLYKTPIAHRNFQQAYQQVMAAVDALRGEPSLYEARRLILLVGPTGAGKTCLIQKLGQTLSPNGTFTDEGMVPFVYILLQATNAHGVHYRDAHISALRFMAEPMIERKVIANLEALSEVRNVRRIYGRCTEAAFRDALIEAFRYRRTQLYCVDDGQELLKTRRMLKLSDPLDTLRGFVDLSPAQVMLCGVYETLEMWAGSAHLMRRTNIVELARYRNTGSDWKEFNSVLKNLDGRAPLRGDSYCAHAEWLWLLSYGCVGKVVDIIGDGLRRAISAGATELTWAHIESQRRFAKEIARHKAEVDNGEEWLKVYELKGDSVPLPSKARSKAKVGHRKPRRDAAFGLAGEGY